MDKPIIKDKATLAYVEFLENEIESFKTHTKKKFYLGIQRQLDLLGDEMLAPEFKVSMKRGEKDSGFDGFFDMITKGEAIIKAMEKFEQQAFPSVKDESKKVVKEDGVEQFIKSKTNSITT
jgi:hypothetical protein